MNFEQTVFTHQIKQFSEISELNLQYNILTIYKYLASDGLEKL